MDRSKGHPNNAPQRQIVPILPVEKYEEMYQQETNPVLKTIRKLAKEIVSAPGCPRKQFSIAANKCKLFVDIHPKSKKEKKRLGSPTSYLIVEGLVVATCEGKLKFAYAQAVDTLRMPFLRISKLDTVSSIVTGSDKPFTRDPPPPLETCLNLPKKPELFVGDVQAILAKADTKDSEYGKTCNEEKSTYKLTKNNPIRVVNFDRLNLHSDLSEASFLKYYNEETCPVLKQIRLLALNIVTGHQIDTVMERLVKAANKSDVVLELCCENIKPRDTSIMSVYQLFCDNILVSATRSSVDALYRQSFKVLLQPYLRIVKLDPKFELLEGSLTPFVTPPPDPSPTPIRPADAGMDKHIPHRFTPISSFRQTVVGKATDDSNVQKLPSPEDSTIPYIPSGTFTKPPLTKKQRKNNRNNKRNKLAKRGMDLNKPLSNKNKKQNLRMFGDHEDNGDFDPGYMAAHQINREFRNDVSQASHPQSFRKYRTQTGNISDFSKMSNWNSTGSQFNKPEPEASHTQQFKTRIVQNSNFLKNSEKNSNAEFIHDEYQYPGMRNSSSIRDYGSQTQASSNIEEQNYLLISRGDDVSLLSLGERNQGDLEKFHEGPQQWKLNDEKSSFQYEKSGGSHYDKSGGSHYDKSGGSHYDKSGVSRYDKSGGFHYDKSGRSQYYESEDRKTSTRFSSSRDSQRCSDREERHNGDNMHLDRNKDREFNQTNSSFDRRGNSFNSRRSDYPNYGDTGSGNSRKRYLDHEDYRNDYRSNRYDDKRRKY